MSKTTDYKNKFNQEKYDSLRIVVPKGRKSDVEKYSQEKGLSVNALVNNLLRDAIGISDEEWKSKPPADET